MTEEKRTFARLAFRADANIQDNDRIIDGEVNDLSVGGVFIRAGKRTETDRTVSVTIYNTTIYNLKAKVVRVTASGMGLQFEDPLVH